MDAVELLAREDEFKRLNKQLEKKTESLMKEIEHVMAMKNCYNFTAVPLDGVVKQNTDQSSVIQQKQDFFSDFSPNLMLATPHNKKKHCCTPSPPQPETPIKRQIKKKALKLDSPKSLESDSEFELNKTQTKNNNTRNDHSKPQNRMNKTQNRINCDCCSYSNNNSNGDMEFLYAFVNINVKEKVLPPSFSKESRVSVESVCKFLSSKIKLMQEQIDKLQNTIEKKASQCESHLTQLAELESERMTLLNKSNSMKSSTADMRAKYMALQKRLDEKDKLYKDQRSEADKLTAELKRLRLKNANVEAKCASQEQIIENLKQQLDLAKRSEKELRDSTRQQSSAYDNAISRLEAQLSARVARSDKQMALINNLRKQIALLTTDVAVNALSVEYSEFLHKDF